MRVHPALLIAFTSLSWLVAPAAELPLHISWGHRSTAPRDCFVRLAASELSLDDLKWEGGEAEDILKDGVARSRAGSGDVDGLGCVLKFSERSIVPITDAQAIWKHLFQHTDAGATRRLQADPGYRPDPRRVTVQLDEAGTRGFTLTVDQLLTQRTFWFPELDVFVAAGAAPVSFAAHLEALGPAKGQRILDRVDADPEASYAQYASRWEDMGGAEFNSPNAVPPGHIVCLTWDSALYKFGVDRQAGVRNDYGRMERFQLSSDFGDPGPSLAKAWKGQRLTDGLPVLTTTFEKDGVRCEIEQFAFPLEGPPVERRGDIRMVLLERVRLTELSGRARTVPFRLVHERDLAPESGGVSSRDQAEALLLEDAAGHVLLAVQGAGASARVVDLAPAGGEAAADKKPHTRKSLIEVPVSLAAGATREFIVKLPSPALTAGDGAKLVMLDYVASRAATLKFWGDLLAQGALFNVPEEPVNALFRANLWHALRLPRRHGGSGPALKMDLPYSNFAYDQVGTPWPVNQSVYVDYMLYDLRGHHAISEEEHAVMYRNNQEANGHVGGFANWGVYSPGMLYSVAQHFLLSGDRASFERLLPQTLRALDWCVGEMKRANDPGNPAPGLIRAGLNDLSHEARSWAFNQAYFVAGTDLLGRALEEIRHPRAAECRAVAEAMRIAVEREFGRASVRSAAVQLADGTWSAYVPCDAQASGRLFKSWYPTDVDTGPLHLSRLKALDPRGPLTTAILNDHEDNLLIHQWGAINEPVYNMQGTAYLLRDEPKRAIRTFYSTMACAFSHSVFEPVEHRWGWPQYFGPPSTDGAWFELYRNLLIHERDDDVLVLAQATPRAWLENGKRIEVQRAPTYYGPLSMILESRAGSGDILATLDLSDRKQPGLLLLRLRHPDGKPMRAVTVNGKAWTEFDPRQEWVRLTRPASGRYVIVAKY